MVDIVAPISMGLAAISLVGIISVLALIAMGKIEV